MVKLSSNGNYRRGWAAQPASPGSSLDLYESGFGTIRHSGSSTFLQTYFCNLIQKWFVMVSLSDHTIKEIAEMLDSGFICYVNIYNGAYLSIRENLDIDDPEAYHEDIAEVEKNPANYLEIEPPMTSESFRIMEGFIDSLPDQAQELKLRLEQALRQPKPFRHFKFVIDHAGPCREEWFAFKDQAYIDYVKMQLGNRFIGD